MRQWAVDVLDEEDELREIVQLVGKDALPDDQQLTLDVARYLREAFLQQNAFNPVDMYSPPEKTYRILQAIQRYSDEAFAALDASVPIEEITAIEAAPDLNRIAATEEYEEFVDEVEAEIEAQLRELY